MKSMVTSTFVSSINSTAYSSKRHMALAHRFTVSRTLSNCEIVRPVSQVVSGVRVIHSEVVSCLPETKMCLKLSPGTPAFSSRVRSEFQQG